MTPAFRGRAYPDSSDNTDVQIRFESPPHLIYHVSFGVFCWARQAQRALRRAPEAAISACRWMHEASGVFGPIQRTAVESRSAARSVAPVGTQEAGLSTTCGGLDVWNKTAWKEGVKGAAVCCSALGCVVLVFFLIRSASGKQVLHGVWRKCSVLSASGSTFPYIIYFSQATSFIVFSQHV